MLRRPTPVSAVVGVAGIAVAVVTLAACGGGHSKDDDASPNTQVSVSLAQCGAGWTVPKAGQQHFVLKNTDFRAGEVLLTDAKTAAVYAEVEPIGPGTTAALDIDLGSGSYAFRCAMEDEATVVGPTVTIAGDVKSPTQPVLSVTQADLIASTKQYEAYVSGRLPKLAQLTTALQTAIDRGELAQARTAWLNAHLEYERLGAAYGAFGDLDGEINGLPQGLPDGVKDKDWTGFHRIEYGLWHGESLSALRPLATDLSGAVAELGKTFSQAQIDPLELSIRAHEISENAVQFELTGETDFGSRSNLATVRANLDGTNAVIAVIKPLLTPRDAQFAAINTTVNRAVKDLDSVRTASASYPPLDSLSQHQRQVINSDLSELTEVLAPVASILEPRRAS